VAHFYGLGLLGSMKTNMILLPFPLSWLNPVLVYPKNSWISNYYEESQFISTREMGAYRALDKRWTKDNHREFKMGVDSKAESKADSFKTRKVIK
jgi:hypothetical protein